MIGSVCSTDGSLQVNEISGLLIWDKWSINNCYISGFWGEFRLLRSAQCTYRHISKKEVCSVNSLPKEKLRGAISQEEAIKIDELLHMTTKLLTLQKRNRFLLKLNTFNHSQIKCNSFLLISLKDDAIGQCAPQL